MPFADIAIGGGLLGVLVLVFIILAILYLIRRV